MAWLVINWHMYYNFILIVVGFMLLCSSSSQSGMSSVVQMLPLADSFIQVKKILFYRFTEI